MKILWILFVWPEPTSSTAGARTLQLMELCRAAGHEVVACSPCQPNQFQEALEGLGIKTAQFPPNDSAFDDYLKRVAPEVVFFDRFMIEEQFSWRVKAVCPAAVRILDTVDLHSLRRARQRGVVSGQSGAEPFSEDSLREISAIYRSDLSLIISEAEMTILQEQYHLPSELLALSTLFYPTPAESAPFEDRANLVAIGNFNHPPNADSYRFLRETLWPEIRAEFKKQGIAPPELHIFGAYPPQAFTQLDNPATGFRVKGWTPDAFQTLTKYRVNLAPLRFGAGLKGKISDGWFVGTPCAATPIAAEGMSPGMEFGGIIAEAPTEFARGVVDLYTNQAHWQAAKARGVEIVARHYNRDVNGRRFLEVVEATTRSYEETRRMNLVGAMLWYHKHRSTEFFSRWIEEKNREK